MDAVVERNLNMITLCGSNAIPFEKTTDGSPYTRTSHRGVLVRGEPILPREVLIALRLGSATTLFRHKVTHDSATVDDPAPRTREQRSSKMPPKWTPLSDVVSNQKITPLSSNLNIECLKA